MKSNRISATQAVRTFSDLLNRVQYRGERFTIERGGEPICELAPVRPFRCTGGELLGLLRSLPQADAGFAEAVSDVLSNQQPIPESPWEP